MHNYVIGQASHPTTKNHFGPIHNALLHAGRWKRNQHFLCGSVRLYMYTAPNGHPTLAFSVLQFTLSPPDGNQSLEKLLPTLAPPIFTNVLLTLT